MSNQFNKITIIDIEATCWEKTSKQISGQGHQDPSQKSTANHLMTHQGMYLKKQVFWARRAQKNFAARSAA